MPGLLANAQGEISTNERGELIVGEEGDPCCCGQAWIRAVACSSSTVPQIIIAAVGEDGQGGGAGGCAASACPVAGGMLVVYAGRCYVIEAGDVPLAPGCVMEQHTFAARLYPDRPDGIDVGTMTCLGPAADCSDPRCDLPPPVGCCVESISFDCAGNRRRCEGGRDVLWTRDTLTETVDTDRGFVTLRRFTEHLVMRARCVGTNTVLSIDPSSFQENHLERTGFPDSTTRLPITFVPAGTYRTPGNTPLAADGQPPPQCSGDIQTGTYRETWATVTGCNDGTYARDITDVGHTQTDRMSWRWEIADPCDRGPGFGGRPLPPGIDPSTLRPFDPCVGCGA